MIKVILSGCNGKMGRVIDGLIANEENMMVVAGFDINTNIQNPYPVFTDTDEFQGEADCIIDFSHPSNQEKLIPFVKKTKIPIVVCTTGLSPTQVDTVKELSKTVPVFFSANMSLGINLILDLVKRAAKVLESDFDIEIVEKHHNLKIDAPSGTAFAIADAISEAISYEPEYKYDRHAQRKKREKTEIGIHAVRGGTIVGDHDVIFAGNNEVIEISHKATSREVFAVGAVRAAKFIAGKKPGLYSMTDYVNSF